MSKTTYLLLRKNKSTYSYMTDKWPLRYQIWECFGVCLHLFIVVVFENLASNLPFTWVISMNSDLMDTFSSNTQEIHFKDVKIDIFENTKVICKKFNQIFRLHIWKKIFVWSIDKSFILRWLNHRPLVPHAMSVLERKKIEATYWSSSWR